MSTICPHIASLQLTRPTGSNHRYEDCLDRWNMGASAHVPVLRSNACCTTGAPAHRRRTDSPSSSMRNVPYVPLSSGQQEAGRPRLLPPG